MPAPAIRRASLTVRCTAGLLAGALALVAGCAPTAPRSPLPDTQRAAERTPGLEPGSEPGSAPLLSQCAADLRAWERAFSDRGMHLSEPRRVPGYPGLGTNRLLASFQVSSMSPLERADWLKRLVAAGERRRALQHRMLFGVAPAGTPSRPDALEDCARRLAEALAGDLSALDTLQAAVQVDDEYVTARRVLGFYALTSLPIRAGIKQLQSEIRTDYAQDVSTLAVHGELRRYALSPAFAARFPPAVAAVSALQVEDSLGPILPDAGDSTVNRLFAAHAPILEVDDAGSFDRPGAPYFDAAGVPALRSATPLAYRYTSLTRFAGALRLQLNYVFWFSERPRDGAWDTLGGRLDGIVWRVTLDASGRVLMYDSIHPCGCYQLFFPGEGVALRAGTQALAEPPIVPQPAPAVAADENLVLRVSSSTHFLQRVYASPAPAAAGPASDTQAYELADYRELYVVDSPTGVHSLFARDGLVPGTTRAERFYLWPTGVLSPGAMRERGRHATAFLGERHFDDADLLDQLFTLGESSGVSR